MRLSHATRCGLGLIALLYTTSYVSELSAQTAPRVFLYFAGNETEVEALEDAVIFFQRAVLRAERLEFAGTAEMEAVYSDCREAIVVSATEERECQLQAARRVMVDELLEVGIQDRGHNRYRLTLEVWSPDSNGLLHADLAEVEADSMSEAAETGFEALAHSYLCYRDESHCGAWSDTSARDLTTPQGPSVGRLEIIGVEPAPVTVLVAGREVGTAPGQFLDLPLGDVEVLLQAPGYEDLTLQVTLTEESMEVLRGLTLEAESATLVIACNVEGAEVEIDGRRVGDTRGGDEVGFEVARGRRRLRVSRDGYVAFEQPVTLSPGGRTTIEVELEVELAPTAPTAPEGFVLIEAGTFEMGSPAGEPGREGDEVLHGVTISSDFYLQVHEVTQGEWRSLVGNNPSYFSSCGDDCPVEMVSWYEAVAYANALSREEGLEACYEVSGASGTLGGGCSSAETFCTGDFEFASVELVGLDCEGYRLPTEAEWEYGARAGSNTALYSGDIEILGERNAPALDAIAWYGGNSGVSYSGGWDCSGWDERQHSSASRCGTHPVGGKRANGWGLYDMLGNVWEWSGDGVGDYPSRAVTDPLGADSGRFRVYRGGGWSNFARNVRSAYRGNSAPGSRGRSLGFRLVRSAR